MAYLKDAMILLKIFFSKHQNKVILAIRLLNSRSKVNLKNSMAPFAMMTSTASMTSMASMASLTSKNQKNTCTIDTEWFPWP